MFALATKRSFTFAVLGLSVVLGSALAQAELNTKKGPVNSIEVQPATLILSGTYKGKDDSRYTMYVKTESSEQGASQYALLTFNDSSRSVRGGLFRIEQIDSSSLSFVKIGVVSSGILSATNDYQPAFSGSIVPTVKGPSLMLMSTGVGNSLGCAQSIQFEIDKTIDASWVSISSLQTSRLRVNRDYEIDLSLNESMPLREFNLGLYGGDDTRFLSEGQYLVREQIAGIGLARKKQLNSLVETGFTIDRNPNLTMISLKSSSGKPRLFFMESMTVNQCLSRGHLIR